MNKHSRLDCIWILAQSLKRKPYKNNNNDDNKNLGDVSVDKTHAMQEWGSEFELEFQHPQNFWEQPTIIPALSCSGNRDGIPRASWPVRLDEFQAQGKTERLICFIT